MALLNGVREQEGEFFVWRMKAKDGEADERKEKKRDSFLLSSSL